MPPLSCLDSMMFEELNSSLTSLASDPVDLVSSLKKERASSSKKCRQNLRFDLFDDIYEIPHIDDLSDEEIDATWYSKEEYQEFRKSCIRTVRLMEKEDSDDSSCSTIEIDIIECSRGLERHTDKGRAIRKREQETYYLSVMTAQQLVENYDISLTDVMAELCASSFSKSRRDAHLAALNDEDEVRKMWQ